MKRKVGDTVQIRSIEWYNANKDSCGNVPVRGPFISQMSAYCGKTAKITSIEGDWYRINLDKGYYSWVDEEFEDVSQLKVGEYVLVSDFNIPNEADEKRIFLYDFGERAMLRYAVVQLSCEQDYKAGRKYDVTFYRYAIPAPVKPTSYVVELNAKYSAIVTKDEVVVGCQSFPISVISKLKEAHDKLNH